MTPQQKLEEIRQRVAEVNPSILDLEFGCRVRWKTISCEYVVLSDFGLKGSKDQFWAVDIPTSDSNQIVKLISVTKDIIGDKSWEIIGRPIQLHDVLMLLENLAWYWNLQDGCMMMWRNDQRDVDAVRWDLPLPLEDQPEDVVSFIHNIVQNQKV